jgi:tetratricopeptide (TPR) repeat protein
VGQNNLDEALEQFQRLQVEEAAPSETRTKIGLIYYGRRDFARASTEFNLVLAGNPDNHRVRYFLGASYAQMRDDERAIEELTRIPEESEYFSESRIQLASLYDRNKEFSKAIESVQAALSKQKGKNRKELLNLLASLYHKAKDYSMAIQTLQEVLDLDPKSDQAHFRLGALYDERKNKDKTIEHMKKAIELDPKNAAALNYLGYTYAEMGIYLDEAEELIVRALKLESNDGFYIDSLGWVYYQKGDYSKAVEQLERAVGLVIDDPTIIEHLGDAYAKLGKLQQAILHYREAYKNSKEKDQLERIQQKIQRLEKEI